MRLSLRESIKYLIDSTQDQVCPECQRSGPFSQVERSFEGVPRKIETHSADVISCVCGFQWESAFEIIMFPVVPMESL